MRTVTITDRPPARIIKTTLVRVVRPLQSHGDTIAISILIRHYKKIQYKLA